MLFNRKIQGCPVLGRREPEPEPYHDSTEIDFVDASGALRSALCYAERFGPSGGLFRGGSAYLVTNEGRIVKEAYERVIQRELAIAGR